ncbi:MAG TPA: M20/M25/M40 family metallo-hydrolase, partial [Pirellulales bacterium]
AVFFDLGDTLGSASVAGNPPRLARFDVFPFVPGVLDELVGLGLKLGVISNTGNEDAAAVNAVLAPTGLLPRFDPALLVYSGAEPPFVDNSTTPPTNRPVTKRIPEIFRRAAARAGMEATPEQCLYVGEDASERLVAESAGWQVCPHPKLVKEMLAGETLRFVRLTVPPAQLNSAWRDELQRRAFLPAHVTGRRGGTVFGVASGRVVRELGAMGFDVDLLGEAGAPGTADLYLLRDDVASRSGFLSTRGEVGPTFAAAGAEASILKYLADGSVIASLRGDQDPDDLHFEGASHGHTLRLGLDPLLWEQPLPESVAPAGFIGAEAVAATATAEVSAALAVVSPDEVLNTVKRYSGELPLDGAAGAKITSRHIRHDDNAKAVAQLAADLTAIGGGRLQVSQHRFGHSGLSLHNVEAELQGVSPELVLITAHLDSTAAFHDNYNPSGDSAPGADDDASGVAAVLAAAKAFVALTATTPLERTVRFVLFNAEEQGLIGSKAYAQRSKARGEAIAAVWQMDMIGFDFTGKATWEVHCGYEPSPVVESLSLRLGELLVRVAPVVSPDLEVGQVYHSNTPPNSPGGLRGDPAARRSDHGSFHDQGYPACVVSEDFFVGPGPDAPAQENNIHYHQPTDQVANTINPTYAANLARAVAAAAWWTASSVTEFAASFAASRNQFAALDGNMAKEREFDSRRVRRPATDAGARESDPRTSISRSRSNAMTGTPAVVRLEGTPATGGSLIDRAISFAQKRSASLGFAEGQPVEFVADPAVQRTSAGAAAVNLTQTYRGLTVFQMGRIVRFAPTGETIDAAGDTAPLPTGLKIDPVLQVESAVLKAAQHLASTAGGHIHNFVGEEEPAPEVDIEGFTPEKLAGFPGIPSQASVLDKGPFENAIPAYLLLFCQPDKARLAWHIVITLKEFADQFIVIVAADDPNGEILYCKSTVSGAAARGNVYEFNPRDTPRRHFDFPRPGGDYPAMPGTPISAFPTDWVATDLTVGNFTRATLGFSPNNFRGANANGIVDFDPADPVGDEQKILNIFYFCNFMHDLLYVLGFDEASGNFQQVNFGNAPGAGDPVRARAHSGQVTGVANMATAPDGLPPLMNMGLFPASNRHTAFDSDVVFHEYVHGLTNRLVGGRLNASALDKEQSGGLGEGWSDFYAITIRHYFRLPEQEKFVTGDWVTASANGIRHAPYNEAYPWGFGDLATTEGVHWKGEVWCATLMSMARRLRTAIRDEHQGYRIAWQAVTDGLKLTPANPTFLDARDAILRAIDDLGTSQRFRADVHLLTRRAAWEAFARFGMGLNAFSSDADVVDDIVADDTIPPGI